jgi:hypothetical protein
MHLSGGSGGVTLLQLPEGVVCLKPQGSGAAGEMFAGRLAGFLGTRAAALRVVKYVDPEFGQIREALRNAPAALEEHRSVARRHHGKSEFIGLLEFVKGVSVQGLEAHAYLKSLAPAALRGVWNQVGHLVALDGLINNFDRVPLLWDNDGNTANLLLQLDDNDEARVSVIGIDQAVTAIIDHGPGLARYLDRVGVLARTAFRGDWQADLLDGAGSEAFAANEWSVTRGLQRVREAFQVSCGVEADLNALMEGLRDGLSTIADRWEDSSLPAALDAASAAVTHAFAHATVAVGVDRLFYMRDFVASTAAAVAAARAEVVHEQAK